MKKSTRGWLIVAGILILVGGILFTAALYSCHWDFTNLNTIQFTTRSYEITEPFHNIAITSGTADIFLIASDFSPCRVECFEKEAAGHTVDVQNDTLTIAVTEELQIENLIGISSSKPMITIYIPPRAYGDLIIQLTTGNVTCRDTEWDDVVVSATTGDLLLENVDVTSMDLTVNTGSILLKNIQCEGAISTQSRTGNVNLTGIRCNSLHSGGSTGNILLKDIIAQETISLSRTSGDLMFEDCDASDLFLKVTTGDITGTLLTDKVFVTHTTTGTVEVPHSIRGGTCEVHTTTGNIRIFLSRE